MPQRVSNERLRQYIADCSDEAHRLKDVYLDLLDARQQVRDANAAIMRLQRELEAARKEREGV